MLTDELHTTHTAVTGFAFLLPSLILLLAGFLKYSCGIGFLYDALNELVPRSNPGVQRVAFIAMFAIEPLVALGLVAFLLKDIAVAVRLWRREISLTWEKTRSVQPGMVGLAVKLQRDGTDLSGSINFRGSIINLIIAAISICFVAFYVAHLIAG